MNWTEGNLSRHSRSSRRNQLLARQKQHFAKARNRSLYGHGRQNPVSISFLEPGHIRSGNCRARNSPTGSGLSQPPSPLLPRKQKHQKHIRESNDRGGAPSSTNQEKRKRLLDQSDWAGLRFQQPIEISFPGEICDMSHSRWSRVGHTQNSPAAKLGGYTKAVEGHPTGSTRLQKRPMRIQVGSQEVQPSMATSSSPSIRRYSLAPRPLATKAQNKSGHISSPVSSQVHQLYVNPDDDNKPSRISKDGLLVQPRTHDKSSLYGAMAAVRPETPANIICSSSIIHEPIPRRAGGFRVLQWSPTRSDGQGSLQVEIEMPAKPALEKTNHQSWKDWAANLSDNISHDTGHDSSASVMLLPDSDAPLPSHLQVKLPAFEIPSEADGNENLLPREQVTIERRGTSCFADNNETTLPLPKQTSQNNSKSTNDLNNEWMKFIFNDSDEIETDNFKKAAHQAAVELRPSNTSDTSAEGIETVATCGTDPLMTWNEQNDKLSSLPSCDSQVTGQNTIMSETAASNIATVGSSSMGEAEEQRFRFTLPKTFVGKFADKLGVHATRPSSTQSTELEKKKKKRRGRRKKKALDGRADIRGLPDFYGDPIEEFEED
ncbi:hypothetical protein F4775DRAFT_564894 [Biscogniauxia sp. FL1348]|nr:hypothetical protein F4775DRAFT_564894 [Biscogniauxia sp. FL1348]